MKLGDFAFEKKSFAGLASTFRVLKKKALSETEKSAEVSQSLLKLILEEPEPCFLLGAVIQFIEKVAEEKLVSQYTMNSFELWLNQDSGLSTKDQYRIRAKIAGKWVERSDYQVFFPIGMGKVYEGSHFVTAHKSPDLDTTVASFWGWLDAFAARVSDGLHIWNLPGGPPASQVEIAWIFEDLFGKGIFSHLAKTKSSLQLSAFELMTKKGLLEAKLSTSMGQIGHGPETKAVAIIGPEGQYLSDWHEADFEQVQQVILLFSSTLRWFVGQLNVQLMNLFAREHLQIKDVREWLKKLFDLPLEKSEPIADFSSNQKKQVERFILRVLGLKQGLSSTFEEIASFLSKIGQIPFEGALAMASSMQKASIFDAKGKLIEERPRLFAYLEQLVIKLQKAIFAIRSRLEKLDIGVAIKQQVFGHETLFISVREEVEEIRRKMDAYASLIVAQMEKETPYALGTVHAASIRKSILGTVSLRDFCNKEEIGVASYLDVISVIDHHKSALTTAAPPFALVADAQSCNTLVARQAFLINDRYSLLNQKIESIEKQYKQQSQKKTSLALRLTNKLLKRKLAAENKGSFYVHPAREWAEYLHFLYAIFDDTDLLTKVTPLDVEVVASLLNRMKTIATRQESEVISLADLPRDEQFAKKGAQRILQHEETYSLYRKIYQHKEKEVERNLVLAVDEKTSTIFADTKEQNGCCRIGQTKLFTSNIPFFKEKAPFLREAWLKKAEAVHKEKPEIDLHIHMTSTIVSAEEVYKGKTASYTHRDEMWIWCSAKDLGTEHLKRFLSHFQQSPGLQNNSLEATFFGSRGAEFAAIFKESFLPISHKFSPKGKSDLVVLSFAPGSLNSRKAMVSPFLPSV